MKYPVAFPAVTGLALAACQPAKSPERGQAERIAAALKDKISALGGEPAIDGQPVTPEQMAAAMEQAGAMARVGEPGDVHQGPVRATVECCRAFSADC